jgi:hypothetical protein
MEAILSSETSVFTRATPRQIPEDGILLSILLVCVSHALNLMGEASWDVEGGRRRRPQIDTSWKSVKCYFCLTTTPFEVLWQKETSRMLTSYTRRGQWPVSGIVFFLPSSKAIAFHWTVWEPQSVWIWMRMVNLMLRLSCLPQYFPQVPLTTGTFRSRRTLKFCDRWGTWDMRNLSTGWECVVSFRLRPPYILEYDPQFPLTTGLFRNRYILKCCDRWGTWHVPNLRIWWECVVSFRIHPSCIPQ